jgi:hypothetical protein
MSEQLTNPLLLGIKIKLNQDIKLLILKYLQQYSDYGPLCLHIIQILDVDAIKITINEIYYDNKKTIIRLPEQILFKDKHPGLCVAAIKEDPYILRLIKNQTFKICLAAVQQRGYTHALMFVQNQTFELCLAAVQENGGALEHVKNQTPEICQAAVQQNGRALEYVKNQTPEICLAAVQENGCALEYIKNQTPEICLAALKQNIFAFNYVENKTDEICLVVENMCANKKMEYY